jgi:hypothetical protein
VETLAGEGISGDIDGLAPQARFHQPMGVLWHNGILYIADTFNNKIKTMPFNAAQ